MTLYALNGRHRVMEEITKQGVTVYTVYRGTALIGAHVTKDEARKEMKKLCDEDLGKAHEFRRASEEIEAIRKIDRRGAIEATRRKIVTRGISS